MDSFGQWAPKAPEALGEAGLLRSEVAIKMTQPWQFDENQPWVPASLRAVCSIPETIKTQGQLHLHPGEEGFLIGESLDGLWGVATFKREGHEEAINVLVPMNRIIKGAQYRSLQDKLNDRPPTMNQTANIPPGPSMDRYVWHLWRNFQRNIGPLRSRGLPSRLVDTIFNHSNFDRTIETVVDGFTQPARQLMSDGKFTLRDLLSLRPISASYPTKNFQGIYVRIYTNMAGFDPDVVGVYVGQSQTSIWGRQQDHDGNTDDLRNKSPHYNIARRTPENCRHAVPIILFDRTKTLDSMSDIFYLAEQTVLLLLNSYSSDMMSVDENIEGKFGMHTMLRLRAVMLRRLSDEARLESGWPLFTPVGCNRISPLFQFHTADIKAFHFKPASPGARGYSIYKQPVFFNEDKKRNEFKTTLQIRKTDGSRVTMAFSIGKETREALRLPKRMEAFLVFEIMHDGKSHDIPWVPCPAVGPYENFEQLSSLGARVEYRDSFQSKWFSIPLQCALRTDSWSKLVEDDSTQDLLRQYKKWMLLPQVLQGITYTGDLNGFEESPYMIAKQVIQLEFDHLKQTCRWVEQPRKFQPAPAPALWLDNCAKMRDLFSGPHTIIGPSAPPANDHDFWKLEHCDGLMKNRPRQCDTCTVSTLKRGAATTVCERDPERTDVWVCRRCSVLGRPCTFSPRSVLRQNWGDRPPHMKTTRPNAANFSRYPDGHFRLLAFWPNLTPEQRKIATEIREPFEMLENWGEADGASNVTLEVDEDAVEDSFLDDGDIAMPDMDDTESDGDDGDGARSNAGSDDSYVN